MRSEILCLQVFEGDMAYLHQTGVIAKSQDVSLDSWARDYFLASEADRQFPLLQHLNFDFISPSMLRRRIC